MRIRVALLASFAALLLLVLLVGMTLGTVAQGDITPKTATPKPSPTNNGGSAKWTVNSMTFQSTYPKGFNFSLDVSSTGGKIVEAQVLWQHAPSVRRHAVGNIDPSGKITASWTPGMSDSVPQWVGVDYWWSLKDEAGNTFETPHQYDEYADNTRKWHRAESDDIVIFWQDGVPDEIGQDAIEAVAKQRAFYYQNWGKLLNYRPHVLVYANYKAVEEWNPGMGTPAGGVIVEGQTSSSWGGTVQVYFPQEGPRILAWGTILHEIDHLYQAFNGTSSSECWIIEGDATYFEIAQSYDYLARVQDMAVSGKLPTLQNGGPSCRGTDARDGYDIGYAFFKYLEATYGPDAHRQFWTLLAQGKTNRDALKAVTGKEFVDMETDFRSWLGMDNPEPPTAMPTLEFSFPPTPTYAP